jgi:16S rRNA G966 N2-methylase RsmD
MIHFSNKRYNIIYIDPPWKYNSRAEKKSLFT